MDAQALGRYLRETRENQERSLEDAEQALKIRQRILESFELGQFTFSDATLVQTRGFIRNYARWLGLDEDRVVIYYESALEEATHPRRRRSTRASQTAQQVPIAPRKITDTNPSLPAVPTMLDRPARRSNILNALVMLLLAGASLAVIAFVLVQLVGQAQQNLPDPADASILGQLPPSPTFTPVPTFTPPPLPTQIELLQPNYTGSGVVVSIELTQRAWLQVSSDGIQRFTGIARPGDLLPDFIGNDNVTVTASNAESLKIIYNGQRQGLYGGRGQKVDIVFTVGNVQVSSEPGFEPTSEFTATALPISPIDVGATVAALTPSPTPGPSPTPTNTPTVTPTFTPSNTPLPSPTITLTPSISPTPSDTPTATLTPTITLTPSPTAILPPRVTQEGLPSTKPAG